MTDIERAADIVRAELVTRIKRAEPHEIGEIAAAIKRIDQDEVSRAGWLDWLARAARRELNGR